MLKLVLHNCYKKYAWLTCTQLHNNRHSVLHVASACSLTTTGLNHATDFTPDASPASTYSSGKTLWWDHVHYHVAAVAQTEQIPDQLKQPRTTLSSLSSRLQCHAAHPAASPPRLWCAHMYALASCAGTACTHYTLESIQTKPTVTSVMTWQYPLSIITVWLTKNGISNEQTSLAVWWWQDTNSFRTTSDWAVS